MNSAIQCQCGTVVVYDAIHTTNLNCPHCGRRWIQYAPMFSDDGTEAKRMPYLCAGLPELWGDDEAMEIVSRVRRDDNHNAPRVAFVFFDGKSSIVTIEAENKPFTGKGDMAEIEHKMATGHGYD